MKNGKPIVLMMLLSSLAIPSLAYEAVPAVVARWAKAMNKEIVWEAGEQLNALEFVLAQDFDSSTAEGFARALSKLNQSIAAATDHSLAPLVACMFDDVIVMRRVDELSCGKLQH